MMKDIYSSYNTFKKKFPDIYNAIISTYGQKYLSICTSTISRGEVKLNITDTDKSRKIIYSLSQKLKELIKNKKVILNNKTKEYSLELENNNEYLQFILFNILYAIRNNTVHGKIASRLNSDYVNGKSYKSSKYVYLLGYMFLSIMLYLSNELEIEDLTFNFKNIELL